MFWPLGDVLSPRARPPAMLLLLSRGQHARGTNPRSWLERWPPRQDAGVSSTMTALT